MTDKIKPVFMLTADHDDRFITGATLQELGVEVAIRFLSYPTDLFDALSEQLPVLIVLDYNTVPETGLTILKTLKSDERYRPIPVVILTDSSQWHYNAECYSHGASTVVKKPATSEMTTHKIKTFFDYWMNVAETSA